MTCVSLPHWRLPNASWPGAPRSRFYDPAARERAITELALRGVVAEPSRSAADACQTADAVVVATEWPEFRLIDWGLVAPTMAGRVIVDVRRVVDVEAAQDAGLEVVTLGARARGRARARAS